MPKYVSISHLFLVRIDEPTEQLKILKNPKSVDIVNYKNQQEQSIDDIWREMMKSESNTKKDENPVEVKIEMKIEKNPSKLDQIIIPCLDSEVNNKEKVVELYDYAGETIK